MSAEELYFRENDTTRIASNSLKDPYLAPYTSDQNEYIINQPSPEGFRKLQVPLTESLDFFSHEKEYREREINNFAAADSQRTLGHIS